MKIKNKMTLNELISLIKKKGFRDTFNVLTQFKNYKADKHTFYGKLNKFSYYNSFFRVEEELIDKGLIEININNGKRVIGLTKKGINVYNKLIELNRVINEN